MGIVSEKIVMSTFTLCYFVFFSFKVFFIEDGILISKGHKSLNPIYIQNIKYWQLYSFIQNKGKYRF